MPHIGSFARTVVKLIGAGATLLACTLASYGNPPSVSGAPVTLPLPTAAPFAAPPAAQQVTLPPDRYLDRTLRMRLRFNDAPLVDRGSATWSYTVNLAVTPTDGIQRGTTQRTSLTIFRDATHDAFEALAILADFSQSQADVVITGITAPCAPAAPPPCAGTLPNDIALVAQMSGERDVNFTVTQKPVIFVAGAFGTVELTAIPDGAVSYEFEWVYVDELEATPSDPFAARDPVRIPSDSPHLKLDVAYPEGAVYVRGRAVGRFAGADQSARRPGSWSNPVKFAIKGASVLAPAFNWNYVANYAEGPNSTANLTFFDGSLNKRQTQSRLASQDGRLVSEAKYDGEGRASIAFLPAPVAGTAFRYEPKFNAVDRPSGQTGTAPYDASVFEGLVPPPAANSAGAGQYYSAAAKVSFPADAYVPDAGGYPYSFARHTRDTTGRLQRTSGAGEALRWREGGGHTVLFSYGTASSTPLRQLFGRNVGRASYYERNTIIDANGQAHVAYVDRAGRTIATALAGDAPEGLESVKSGAPQTLVTYRLDENNVVDTRAWVSRSVNHVTVEQTTNLFFTYDLKGVDYALPGSPRDGVPPVCADCRYNLRIRVTAPDGTTVALRDGATLQTDVNCDQGSGVPKISQALPATAPNTCTASSTGAPGASQWPSASEIRFCAKFSAKGEYEVVKELTIDRGGIAAAKARGEATPGYFEPTAYRRTLMPASSQANVLAPGGSLGTGACLTDCNAFCAEATAGIASDGARQACLNSCTNPTTWAIPAVARSWCESLKQEIDADVAPLGYLGKKTGIPEVQHPEYCHIKEPYPGAGLLHSICGRTEASDEYDYRMMTVGSYDEAVCRGYLDPLGGTPGAPAVPANCTALDHDPFYDPTNIGTSMKGWVGQGMQDYASVPGFASAWAAATPPPLQHPSIWQLAATVKGPNNTPASRDFQWIVFRSLYMGLKQMALARRLEDRSGDDYCPYWQDSHAHVKRPDAVGTIADALAAAQTNVRDSCASTCSGRAAQWTASLETACRTKLSDGFESHLRAQFQTYCAAKCAPTNPPPPNPLPMLTESDIARDAAANGPLSKASIYQPAPTQNCVLVPDGRGGQRQKCFTLNSPAETLPSGCTLGLIAQADVPPGAAAGPFSVLNTPPAGGGGPVSFLRVNSIYQFRPAKPNACMVTVAAAAANAAKELADQQGRIARANALDGFAQYVEATHDANCLGPQLQESFSYQAVPGEYHFTLKYYDQAGNLVQTVPPAGVHPLSDTAANDLASGAAVAGPAHTLASTYTYNTLGQVIAQTTPDGSLKRSWYNLAGQARLSQNTQQALDGRYAYVKYDRRARVIETGLVANAPDGNGVITPLDSTKLQAYAEDQEFPQPGRYTTVEVVTTSYDDYPASVLLCQAMKSRQPVNGANLRGRIAAIVAATSIGAVATCYSYDPHGNITALTQDIPGVATKTTAYDYDILDGKILAIHYQPEQPDRLEHRFTYDPDRRLLTAETSRDGELWERDAGYSYYRHGPLARSELGADRVQGLDYSYAITGWPKGINADTLNPGRDPGRDGAKGAANAAVPVDVFGSAIHYFPHDYTPVGAAALSAELPQAAGSRPTRDPAVLAAAGCTSASATGCGMHDLSALMQLGCPSGQATTCGLYDGNVKATVSAVANAQGGAILGSAHRYDQLYRLLETASFGDVDVAANAWPRTSNDPQLWRTQTAYDPNGNITSLQRCAPTAASASPPPASDFCAKGSGGASLMDDLAYKYPVDANRAITSNRLLSIDDNVPADAYAGDIDGQPADNYGYDASGRLTRDTAAGLTAITWNAASRVVTIARKSDSIEFVYDGLGNRIAKITRPGADPATWSYQYFVCDEKGAILATYRQDPAAPAAATVKLEDQTIFGGSSRIGLWSAATGGSAATSGAPAIALSARLRGDKQYELASYLGNVEATVTDRKTPVIENGAVTHYQANAVNANGYYPFGMLMPGRLTQMQAYRFGYSGLERDDDIKGAGNSYHTSARLFDPRVGRWLSPDPIEVADSSPFVGFSNNPARYSDPRGMADADDVAAPKVNRNEKRQMQLPESGTSVNLQRFDCGSKDNCDGPLWEFKIPDKGTTAGDIGALTDPANREWGGWTCTSERCRITEEVYRDRVLANAFNDTFMGAATAMNIAVLGQALRGAAQAITRVPAAAQIPRSVAAETSTTRVGRWMSEAEYDAMLKTGQVQESYSGTTHVASPADVGAYLSQAKPSSVYVEFDVPRASLRATNEGWAKIVGPNSLEGRLALKKGNPPPQMPAASNIVRVRTKLGE